MKDSELISNWSLEVQRGRNFRSRIYTDTVLRRYENYFRNRYPTVSYADQDVQRQRLRVITDPIVADEARRQVPKIVFDVPYVKVTPLAGRLAIHSMLLERVGNGILRQAMLKRHLKKGCLGTIQHGTGILKVGYDSQFVPSYKQVLEFGFSDSAYDTKNKRREFRDDIYPGMPWVTYQHLRNVNFPEMTDDFTEARWVAFHYWRNLEDVKKDKRLRNTADLAPKWYRYEDIEPSMLDNTPYYGSTKGQVLLTEIRDKESGKMMIFAEDYRKILYKEDDILMSVLGGKLPVEALVFNNNTDYAHGTSDIDLVEEALKELIDVKTQHAKDRRIRVAKFLYRKNSIHRLELEKLVSGSVGAGIAIEGVLEGSIAEFKMSNPYDFYRDEAEIRQRIKEHFGSGAFSNSPQSRRGGKEISGMQQDALMPVHERRDAVNDLVISIFKDVANMIFSFWTEETVVDVLAPIVEQMQDENGQMVPQDITKRIWVAFKGRELRGNFDYAVSATSGRLQDANQNKQEAFELMNFGSQIPGINLHELGRQLFSRFEGVDVDKLFPPMNNTNNAMQPGMVQQLMGQSQGISRRKPQPLLTG